MLLLLDHEQDIEGTCGIQLYLFLVRPFHAIESEQLNIKLMKTAVRKLALVDESSIVL